MSNNIRIIPRDNPLILEIRIESDSIVNNLKAVSSQSLAPLRGIINNILLVRHYKKLILDFGGIELGASGLLAKILMCYEKASLVNCDVYSFNATPRLAMQHKMARLDDLVPVFTVEETPKPEEYDEFFGFNHTTTPTETNIEIEETVSDQNIEPHNKKDTQEQEVVDIEKEKSSEEDSESKLENIVEEEIEASEDTMPTAFNHISSSMM